MNIKEFFRFNSDSAELSLTPEDKLFLEKIAKKIHQHGLVTPAVFFLEMTNMKTQLLFPLKQCNLLCQ